MGQDPWTAIVGAALGVLGIAWTWGSKLRDNSFEFLKKQNAEMATELEDMIDKVAHLKALLEEHEALEFEVKRLRLELAHATAKDDDETPRGDIPADAS
jgi:hypothetical protein